jgi:hypothetical protein
MATRDSSCRSDHLGSDLYTHIETAILWATDVRCAEIQRDFAFLRSVRRLLVIANVPTSPILVTLMMEALSSFETSALTRSTRRNIPEDGILHSHRPENLKSYKGNSFLSITTTIRRNGAFLCVHKPRPNLRRKGAQEQASLRKQSLASTPECPAWL